MWQKLLDIVVQQNFSPADSHQQTEDHCKGNVYASWKTEPPEPLRPAGCKSDTAQSQEKEEEEEKVVGSKKEAHFFFLQLEH